MDNNITEEDFFTLLQKTIPVIEFYSQSFISKKDCMSEEKIEKFIDSLKPFVNIQIVNGITLSKDLQTIIWNENDYDKNYWRLMKRDIATLLLRLIMFDIKGESNMNLIQSSMQWINLYSLALINFYVKIFKNDKDKFLQDLKFFTCILKINLRLFSHDQVEGFFYYLYKLTGLYFENGKDYIREDFDSNNFIEKCSEKLDFLDKYFKEQIKNTIIPYVLQKLKKQKNELSSYSITNMNIRPFVYFSSYKKSDLTCFLVNSIKDEDEKNHVLLEKDNDLSIKQMPWGLKDLIYSQTNDFFEKPQYFILAKIFSDVIKGILFINEENLLEFYSRDSNFGCVYADITTFFHLLIEKRDQEENNKFIESYKSYDKFFLEFNNFKNFYLDNLFKFIENLKENGCLSIDISHLEENNEKYHETLYKLFAFSTDCLFFKKAFIKNQDHINKDIKRIERIWKFFDLLIEIQKRHIFIPEMPFQKATDITDIYQYLVYHVNYFSNITNQEKISELPMEQFDLKNIIEENGGALKNKIEIILQSKVIKDYYEYLDNNSTTKNKYLIPNYIHENKLWNKVKYSKLFTFHSAMTLTELIVVLNDHLPGTFDMIESSIIYILIPEFNHLNRLLNHIGESSLENKTPKNEKINQLSSENPEGGRYMCASLFGDNYASLSYEQAQFIVNTENWDSELEKSEEDDKAIYVEHFRNSFISLNKPDENTERIKMMDNNIKKPIDRLC